MKELLIFQYLRIKKKQIVLREVKFNRTGAVGGAVARCPFSLVVPCHRVIASDGTLGGFGGIEAMKARLLAFEGFDLGLIKGLRPDLQRGTEPRR